MQQLTARRGLTDPFVPAAALALLAVAAAALDATVLCWASVGALAGFSLSGSV
ncbi:hypothetical protein AGRA3207_001438 [Actinomadura graeca]|uniref:Uncharacterized protein n=1 Tax=Actinomadura graeca TaxID=2750812 RepID=A0ABX8QPH1_9ACTN|nr:hypothetical protein [Actinomadura graeca]QXJ20683.1 hypothetical protein AGRA3207_001438 [Actinomadura graeca]